MCLGAAVGMHSGSSERTTCVKMPTRRPAAHCNETAMSMFTCLLSSSPHPHPDHLLSPRAMVDKRTQLLLSAGFAAVLTLHLCYTAGQKFLANNTSAKDADRKA